MSRYVGDLITEVRRDSENESFSSDGVDNYGILTEDFLRFFNFALQRLQSKLIVANTTLFRRSKDIDIVGNQSEYSVSDNVYLGESIVDMRYSPSTEEQDLREIPEIADSNLYYGTAGYVSGYLRRQGKFFLSPIPASSQGFIRASYERQIDQLDLRRGIITAVTVGSGIITTNTITISMSSDDADRISGVTDKYLCVCDKDGNVKAYNIPYTSYNSGTGVFTHAAHTLGTGESIAIGDYITVGKYTTTHIIEIPHPSVERYAQTYAAMKITRKDSNADSELFAKEFNTIEDELIDAYGSSSKDEWEINVSNPDILLLNRRYSGWGR